MDLKTILRLLPGIILFSFLALTLSLALDYGRLNSDFKQDVADTNRLFSQQLASIETVLISLEGLHHASDNLNQAELSSFSEKMLKAYPFIDAIVGLEKVKGAEAGLFERRMNQQGYIGLQLKYEKTIVDKTPDYFHLPVSFIEPMTPVSAKMLGLDIRSLPDMLSVIDFTINTGNVSASKILIPQGMEKPAFFMFKALYLGRYPPETQLDREMMLDGVVALVIDIKHFMAFIKLSSYQLLGRLSNIPHGTSSSQSNARFDVSFDHFIFTKDLKIYEQSYQLVLERKLTLSMINQPQMVVLWSFSMLLFSLMVVISRKRKASKDEIRYLAYFDSLTALPNRDSFKYKLKKAIIDSQKNNTIGVVLFMDIDEFKRINDTLGHDVGDELLKQVSRRLSLQMRHGNASNGNNRESVVDLVTRLGGDEFTVLLKDIKNVETAGVVAKRILEHISEPFHLKSHKVYITCSIGIATFPDDGDDVDQLLMYADTAMYHAKSIGKNNYQYYFKKMSAKIEKRVHLESQLHKAIKNNEFSLYYQPQVDADTNEIVAAEALIRWDQSELGMIYPDEFIQLSEETGQIFSIGEWVINEACRQNKEWQLAGYAPIRVAVNLSGMQFTQDDLCLKISETLERHSLDSNCLELEITESIMMKNIEQTVSIIQDLTSMGVAVSIDDFGTGYSSLSYLKKFPLQALKIDRSFVLDIPEDKDDMMITSAIISMAKNLGLKVIAEGVEEQGQIDFLKQHSCDILQGYYFSRPVPAKEFEKLLKKNVEIEMLKKPGAGGDGTCEPRGGML